MTAFQVFVPESHARILPFDRPVVSTSGMLVSVAVFRYSTPTMYGFPGVPVPVTKVRNCPLAMSSNSSKFTAAEIRNGS